MGTAQYMSPNRPAASRSDARSDIFSLGVVLYHAATGRPPLQRPKSALSHARSCRRQPPSAERLEHGLPREFDLIVERALAKDKERRYSSASELADALRNSRVRRRTFPVLCQRCGMRPEAFVGREPELKRLEELLEQAAGVLAAWSSYGRARDREDDARRRVPAPFAQTILRLCSCARRCVEQYGTGEAYLPSWMRWPRSLPAQVASAAAAMLRTYAPTWCLQLPASFASSGDLERFQRETIGATKGAPAARDGGMAPLGALTASTLLVILLEDLHGADPSSADCSPLCVRHRRSQLLIVGTFRPEDL